MRAPLLIEIGAAAQRWHEAEQSRLAALRALREAIARERGAVHRQLHKARRERKAAEEVRRRARVTERLARKWLFALCLASAPKL